MQSSGLSHSSVVRATNDDHLGLQSNSASLSLTLEQIVASNFSSHTFPSANGPLAGIEFVSASQTESGLQQYGSLRVDSSAEYAAIGLDAK